MTTAVPILHSKPAASGSSPGTLRSASFTERQENKDNKKDPHLESAKQNYDSHAKHRGEATAFSLRCLHGVLDPKNSLSQAVQRAFEIVRDPEDNDSRIFVLLNHEANASAMSNGDILINIGLLKEIRSFEALCALVMHEYKHLKTAHNEGIASATRLGNTAEQRARELLADMSLLDLDRKGINPYGAIDLMDTLDRVAAHSNNFLDIEHGSVVRRRMLLRELTRFWTLDALSKTLTPFDASEALAEAPPAVSCQAPSPSSSTAEKEEFWVDVCRMKRARSSGWRALVDDFLEECLPSASHSELACVSALIWEKTGLKLAEKHSQVAALPTMEALSHVLRDGMLERIGLTLGAADYLAIPDLITHQIDSLKGASQAEISSVAGQVKDLRQAMIASMNAGCGIYKHVLADFDQKIFDAFILTRSSLESLATSVPHEDPPLFPNTASATLPENGLSVEGPVAIHFTNDTPDILLLRGAAAEDFYLQCALETVNVCSSARRLMSALDLGWIEPEMYQGQRPLSFSTLEETQLLISCLSQISAALSPVLRTQLKGLGALSPMQRLLRVFEILEPRLLLDHENAIFAVNWGEHRRPYDINIGGETSVFSAIASFSLYRDGLTLFKDSFEAVLHTPPDELLADMCSSWKSWTGIQDRASYFAHAARFSHQQAIMPLLTPRPHQEALLSLAAGDAKTQFLHSLGALRRDPDDERDFSLVNSPDSAKEKLDFQTAVELVAWPKRVFRASNRAGLTDAWTLSRGDQASMAPLLIPIKTQALNEMAKASSARKMLRIASNTISKFPMFGVSIPQEEYEELWKQISNLGGSLDSGAAGFPRAHQDFESVAAVACLCQGSWSAMTLVVVSLMQAVRLSEDFETAFRYVQKYSFLPPVLLQPALDILTEEKARKPEDLEALRKWAGTAISEALKDGTKMLQTEIGRVLAGKIGDASRLEFLQHATSTAESDVGLKTFMVGHWWQGARLLETDQLRSLCTNAFYGSLAEQKGRGSVKMDQAFYDATAPLPEQITGIHSFEGYYQSLFRLHPAITYLLLHSLLVEGDSAIFNQTERKKALIDSLCDTYVKLDAPGPQTAEYMSAVREALTTGVASSELFFFTGPWLTQVTFQAPATPCPTSIAERGGSLPHVKRIVESVMSELEAGNKLRDPDRNGAGEQTQRELAALDEVAGLVTIRTQAMLSGLRPTLKRDFRGRFKAAEFPELGQYHTFEDLMLYRIGEISTRQRISEGTSIIDLAIILAENSGALGVRWFQLLCGLYLELSAEDREKASKVFDRVRGQSKLQFWDQLVTLSERCPELAELVDSLDEVHEMAGGGSIVTFYKVTDRNGRDYAVGVENPNAAFKSEDLHDFLTTIVTSMAAERPDDQVLALAPRMLSYAVQWIKREIDDDTYLKDNAEFCALNDVRSSHPRAFSTPAGSKWSIRIPDLYDTGTTKVRWEEFVEGHDIAQCRVTDADTDFSASPPVVSQSDARQIASLIARNFAHQFLKTGLLHSDIHPGNFMLTQNGEVFILDRKNLLRLPETDRKFAEKLVRAASLGKGMDKVVSLALDRFVPKDLPQREERLQAIKDEFKESLDSGNFSSPEAALSRVLLSLERNGISMELDWILIVKNFMGLNRIAKWAGFDNLGQALTYSAKTDRQMSPIELAKLGFEFIGK